MKIRLNFFIICIFIFISFTIFAESNIKENIKKILNKDRINNKIIINYFGVNLGTSYPDIIKIIEDGQIDYTQSKNTIKIYSRLTGIEKIEHILLYFTEGYLTFISVKFNDPIKKFDDYYNDIKQYSGLEYSKSEENKAVWSDTEKTLELKKVKKEKNDEAVYLTYYINEYKFRDNGNTFKGIGFSFGIGLNHNLGLMFPNFGVMAFDISCPFTFMYYPDNKKGFGFTYSVGARLNLVLSYMPVYVDLVNMFSFTQKAGRMDKVYFIWEIGLISTLRFYTFYSEAHKNFGYLGGIHLFLGSENKAENNFSFSLGGTLDTVIGVEHNYYSEGYYYESAYRKNSLNFHILIGIDFRWRFNIIKRID